MQEAPTVTLAVRLVAVVGQTTLRPVAEPRSGVRVTPPVKPKVLVSVTERTFPEAPELKFTGVPTLIAKSPT